MLERLGLFQLHAATFFSPAVECLLYDPRILAGQWHYLALAHQHFNLALLGYDLLSGKPLFRHFKGSFCLSVSPFDWYRKPSQRGKSSHVNVLVKRMSGILSRMS